MRSPALSPIVPGIALAPPLDDPDTLLAAILAEVDVSDELVRTAAGTVVTPRRTGWYGDPGATYTYSGITRRPQAWPPALDELRRRLNADFAIALNSCLVGIYDDGSNSVDWHADDEPELRDRIVSVSLGAQRTFMLRRDAHDAPIAVPLAHGSVLVMTVASQLEWQHAVPAEPDAERRVNLTFRVIAHD